MDYRPSSSSSVTSRDALLQQSQDIMAKLHDSERRIKEYLDQSRASLPAPSSATRTSPGKLSRSQLGADQDLHLSNHSLGGSYLQSETQSRRTSPAATSSHPVSNAMSRPRETYVPEIVPGVRQQKQELDRLLSELRDRDQELDVLTREHRLVLQARDTDKQTILELERRLAEADNRINAAQIDAAAARERERAALLRLERAALREKEWSEKIRDNERVQEDLGEKLRSSDTARRAALAEIDSLKSTLEEAHRQNEELSRRCRMVESAVADRDNEARSVTRALHETKLALQDAEQRLSESTSLCNTLERDVADWQDRCQQSERHVESLTESIHSVEQDAQRNAAACSHLERQLAEASEEVTRMRQEVMLAAERDERREQLIQLQKSRQERTDAELARLRDTFATNITAGLNKTNISPTRSAVGVTASRQYVTRANPPISVSSTAPVIGSNNLEDLTHQLKQRLDNMLATPFPSDSAVTRNRSAQHRLNEQYYGFSSEDDAHSEPSQPYRPPPPPQQQQQQQPPLSPRGSRSVGDVHPKDDVELLRERVPFTPHQRTTVEFEDERALPIDRRPVGERHPKDDLELYRAQHADHETHPIDENSIPTHYPRDVHFDDEVSSLGPLSSDNQPVRRRFSGERPVGEQKPLDDVELHQLKLQQQQQQHQHDRDIDDTAGNNSMLSFMTTGARRKYSEDHQEENHRPVGDLEPKDDAALYKEWRPSAVIVPTFQHERQVKFADEEFPSQHETASAHGGEPRRRADSLSEGDGRVRFADEVVPSDF